MHDYQIIDAREGFTTCKRRIDTYRTKLEQPIKDIARSSIVIDCYRASLYAMTLGERNDCLECLQQTIRFGLDFFLGEWLESLSISARETRRQSIMWMWPWESLALASSLLCDWDSLDQAFAYLGPDLCNDRDSKMICEEFYRWFADEALHRPNEKIHASRSALERKMKRNEAKLYEAAAAVFAGKKLDAERHLISYLKAYTKWPMRLEYESLRVSNPGTIVYEYAGHRGLQLEIPDELLHYLFRIPST